MDRRRNCLSRRQFVLGAGAAGMSAVGPGLVGACAIPWSPPSQPPKIWRVGTLFPFAPDDYASTTYVSAFEHGLADLGYIEGRNVIFEHRFAEGRGDRWDEFATELVRLPVDLIFTPHLLAIMAATRATGTIPIVTPVVDLVGNGLAESLAHPGGTVTGLTNIAPQLSGKRLELLKETVPGISRVAMFWQPPTEVRDWQETQAAAELLERRYSTRSGMFVMRTASRILASVVAYVDHCAMHSGLISALRCAYVRA